jgi:predicted DNA-binding transcriptional regulator YafY
MMQNLTLARAIAEKRVLKFTYDGEARVVEPHVYGRGVKGDDLLKGWQTNGFDGGWKLFRVSDIRTLHPTQEGFSGPRQGYKRRDAAMARIYAEL